MIVARDPLPVLVFRVVVKLNRRESFDDAVPFPTNVRRTVEPYHGLKKLLSRPTFH